MTVLGLTGSAGGRLQGRSRLRPGDDGLAHLVIGVEGDATTPTDHAERLYDAARGPKALLLQRHTTHYAAYDRYWTQDSLNVYWDDLKGPKWVLYVPNSGHALEDRGRVFATMAAFVRSVAKGEKLPTPKWTYETRDDGSVKLTLESDVPLEEGRLFTTDAKTRDFRDSKWKFEKMDGEGKKWTAECARPQEGARVIYGEAVYSIGNQKFTLSTQMRILDAPGVTPPVMFPAGTKATPKADAPKVAPKVEKRWF